MPLRRSRLVVALDAAAVSAGRLSWGPSGPRIDACVLVPLSDGALIPSPMEPNLAGTEEVRAALRELRRELGNPERPAILVLPSGVARLALLDPPAEAAPKPYAQFRLAQGLPYPSAEALVEVVALGRGRFLGAAVRRSVVAEYEEAAAAAGWTQGRLDLSPLAALDGLSRRPSEPGAAVDVVLGDVGLSFAARLDGEIQVFRSRLRDRCDEEAACLHAEVERTGAMAGLGSPRIRIVGPGARSLIHALSFRGLAAAAGWEAPPDGLPVEACELPWLGAAR